MKLPEFGVSSSGQLGKPAGAGYRAELVLCKKFVEMHDLEQVVFGKGTACWFLLPADGPMRRMAENGRTRRYP